VPVCPRCNYSKHGTLLADWVSNRAKEFVLPDAVARVSAYLEGC